MFGYNLKNLCIKAEEVSLLPVQVLVEGEMKNLEKCTVIARKDDYSFMIFPKYEEDMLAIAKGIMAVHPEFKQEEKTMKVDTVDSEGNPTEADAHYILVTMPEVDDDRYDALKKGVEALYEGCKNQMDVANTNADVKLAVLTVDETPENMRLIKAERDKLNKQWTEHRDGLYHEKLQEIEDAHNKWLTQKADIDQKQKEEEDARGESVTYSMRMGKHEEEAN
jgi:hypothetical protein